MRQSMLTTIDNPFDPFTQFDDWFAFDEGKGYHSCAYLARIAKTSDELSQQDEDLAIEQAIDEIVTLNILGIYRKVTRESEVIDANVEEQSE
ncbi:MAG: hypothetical protein N2317_08670, partial [Syntrophales bacterium]|nr:hypothetical protein [Syntrophales bacterium]